MEFRALWPWIRMRCAHRRAAAKLVAMRSGTLFVMLNERNRVSLAYCRTLLSRLTPTQQRVAAAGGAVSLNVLWCVFLLSGLHVTVAPAVHEIRVAIGGSLGVSSETPKPPLLREPDTPAVPPPLIEMADAITTDTVMPNGSPDVSVPAQAIAEDHLFPTLPAGVSVHAPVLVRLVLSIATSGAVASAQVETSSGSKTLDQMAIDWVKAHWRYRPALDNGHAITVLTTAVLVFSNT